MHYIIYILVVLISNHSLVKCDLSAYTLLNVDIHCEHSTSENLNFTSEIKVYFYDSATNKTVNYTLTEAITAIPALTYYNASKKHIFYFHGFANGWNYTYTQRIYKGLFELNDIHAILFDYSEAVSDPSSSVLLEAKYYKSAVKNAYYITKNNYELLSSLFNVGLNQSNIHIIGHSLGGHMAGMFGSMVYNNTGIKPARVTGLDPAGPCFTGVNTNLKLIEDSADYVDVIHCNTEQEGTSDNLADAVFYANCAGKIQPGCASTNLLVQWIQYEYALSASCSHGYCTSIFAASMANTTEYTAYQCSDYDKFKNGNCSGNTKSIAGYNSDTSSKGKFYFCTTDTCMNCIF